MSVIQDRARALHRFAKHECIAIDELCIELTDSEAFEALEEVANTYDEGQFNVTLLREDIKGARALKDPWPVMANFKYMGMDVRRRLGVNQ